MNAHSDILSVSSDGLLDSIIAICIILFIVSVIVEKITQLFRKYSPFFKVTPTKRYRGVPRIWKNISKSQTSRNRSMDKIIEREVSSLSLVIGVVVAIAFRIDLFKMIAVIDPRTVLFWSSEVEYTTWREKILFAFSILLTGFFLSFGSKFFHDLLDILFQVKNLKRKMLDDESYNIDNIEQLDEFLNKSYSKITQDAIDQNMVLLTHPDAVGPPMPSRIKKGSRLVNCIDVHLNGNDRGKIPDFVLASIGSDKRISIPVHIVYQVEIPKVFTAQGDDAANSDSNSFKGTLCCKVFKDGKQAFLTCSHVMTAGRSDNYYGQIEPVAAKINGTDNGQFFWAMCNDKYDIALIDPGSEDFTYRIKPAEPRKLTPRDIMTTTISVVCRDGKVNKGKVVNDCAIGAITIEYKDGKHDLENLIVLSNILQQDGVNSYEKITIPGDSGACVYDEKNCPVGMIVAGNNKFSYAIPMTDILYTLSSKIIN